MRSLNALFFRRHLGEVLNRVSQKGQHIVITRDNRPEVVMMPYHEYTAKVIPPEEVERRRKVLENIKKLSKELTPLLKGMDVTREVRRLRDES